MRQELIKTIQELKQVIEETELKVTDAELLDSAIRLFNTIQINNNKSYPKKVYPNTNPEELATEKQIYFLNKAGMTIPKGLTKKKASEFIKELK